MKVASGELDYTTIQNRFAWKNFFWNDDTIVCDVKNDKNSEWKKYLGKVI